MPQDGPGRTAAMTTLLAELKTAPLRIEGRIGWASNGVLLCSAETSEGFLYVVYKPEKLERPLWDFPPGLWRREVAAYELASLTGLVNIPPTIARLEGPCGPGSVQLFVEHEEDITYFEMLGMGRFEEALMAVCAFDLVANNADRKAGHLLLSSEGEIVAIDHGLCFHEHPKLRTVIWDFAGEKLPLKVIEALEIICSSPLDRALPSLTDKERRLVGQRARALLKAGTYPKPPEAFRCYPWPLV